MRESIDPYAWPWIRRPRYHSSRKCRAPGAGFSFFVFSTVFIFFLHGLSFADIVTLKDGSRLLCEVVGEQKAAHNGHTYLQIRVNNSLVLLDRSTVRNVEPTPEKTSVDVNVDQLLERLRKEGAIVTELEEETPPDKSSILQQENDALVAKEIRGWVYVYESARALRDGKGTALETGSVIPLDSILAVSPNSRATIKAADVGEIGLYGKTQIRFDDIRLDQVTRFYRIGLDLIEGKAWINVNVTLSGRNQVIWKFNSARTVVQEAALYLEKKESAGAIDITLLKGKSDLTFWRGDDPPYTLQIGSTLEVTPASNRLKTKERGIVDFLLQAMVTWNEWEPEPLAVNLEPLVPPLKTLPAFGPMPVLHPHRIAIDETMTLPAETRSIGEIIDIYRKALERYKVDVGRYPSDDHGLEALFQSFNLKSWRGPYVPPLLPKRDPWGSKFIYSLYKEKDKIYPDVRSIGPNRKDDKGLVDDIR